MKDVPFDPLDDSEPLEEEYADPTDTFLDFDQDLVDLFNGVEMIEDDEEEYEDDEDEDDEEEDEESEDEEDDEDGQADDDEE